MKKKIFLTLGAIILLALGILIGYLIFKSTYKEEKCDIETKEEKKEKIKNVKQKTIKGKEYYIITDRYDGDYDYQETNLGEISTENISDTVKLFNTTDVLSYYEYTEFCKRWNLKQTYSDQEKNYAVVSYASIGSPIVKAELANYKINDGTISIYLYENINGVTADTAAYFLAIPVPLNIYNEEITTLITSEEAKNIEKYGQKKDPREITTDKPIIYIYPEKEMDVTVKLGNEDLLTTTYPKYNNGWTVTASPNGTLKYNNKNYYGLYWEGKNQNVTIKKDGFVIKGSDTSKFLEEKLSTLGLNEREANEFIIYWLPRMEHNKYNYIRFATKEEIDSYMPLEITPKPDSIIRIIMDFKALDEKIDIQEQKLTTPQRNGYTVVEWGGREIK